MTSPDPTDPVRVDAPTLQDRPGDGLRARADQLVRFGYSLLVDELREAAERLDTLEARLAEQDADLESADTINGGLIHEVDALRGQVTQAVNIVHARLDTARLYAAGAATEAVRDSWTHVARVVEGLLDAFAAAGLPVGGETPAREP